MREILKYGSEVLHYPSKEVLKFDEDLRKLVDEMFEIMKNSKGVGLAAPQVGVPLKVAIVDVSPAGHEGKVVLINPVIKSKSKKYYLEEEGCLSVPELYLPIPRHYSISVEYSDFEGRRNIINASGYFAKAIQHEVDHLEGILFVERFREFFDIEKIEDNDIKEKLREVLNIVDAIKSPVQK